MPKTLCIQGDKPKLLTTKSEKKKNRNRYKEDLDEGSSDIGVIRLEL